MEFLGFVVGGGMVKMDPGKVKAVKEWKSPKNKKELQSFLGFPFEMFLAPKVVCYSN